MKEQKNVDINGFLESLEKLISSKYILAERKINDVLVQVAQTAPVYNLIAKCMVNFDFLAEWNIAISSHFFKLPEVDENRVAFIFCLLSNIDDKNIEFTNFLSKYFSAANSYSAYELFSKTVIVEFRRLILKLLNIGEPKTDEVKNVEQLSKNDNFSILKDLIDGLLAKVKSFAKLKHLFMQKNDLVAVLSTFALVAENRQTEYLYAFRVTINSLLEKNKYFKSEIEQINQIVDQIIRGIYE